jgi:hypothetical protein
MVEGFPYCPDSNQLYFGGRIARSLDIGARQHDPGESHL